MNGQSDILHTAFGIGGLQAVAFEHGDVALNQNFIGVVDDAVHDCFRNWAAGIRVGVNAGIPALGLVLGAENYGALVAGLHDFQQVVGLLREKPDEPFVQNQQAHLLVGGQTFLQLACAAGNTQLVEEFRHTDIADLLEPAAGGVAQGTGDVGLAVAGNAFEDDMGTLVHKFAGGEAQHLRLVQLSLLVGSGGLAVVRNQQPGDAAKILEGVDVAGQPVLRLPSRAGFRIGVAAARQYGHEQVRRTLLTGYRIIHQNGISHPVHLHGVSGLVLDAHGGLCHLRPPPVLIPKLRVHVRRFPGLMALPAVLLPQKRHSCARLRQLPVDVRVVRFHVPAPALILVGKQDLP